MFKVLSKKWIVKHYKNNMQRAFIVLVSLIYPACGFVPHRGLWPYEADELISILNKNMSLKFLMNWVKCYTL